MLRWLALAALVAAGCVTAADAQNYISTMDFDLHADNTGPSGVWSDGTTTIWVADQAADKIFAYHMSNMSRYPDNDFPLHADNTDSFGIWSDGTTMWVSDWGDDKIYAYHMSNMSRDSSREFNNTKFDASSTAPTGIWSDRTTMWVADSSADKIFAYRMSDMARHSDKDIELETANTDPTGIWSDCTTMWVANGDLLGGHDKIYAYNLATKAYDDTKDFDTLSGAGNTVPNGIWSDGATMWVANFALSGNDDKVYAYVMRPAPAPCQPPPAPTVSPPRVFVYIPPPDTTPPTVKSVERTGNATTANHALTWDVRFSESVRVGPMEIHTNYTSVANATIPDLGMVYDTLLADVPGAVSGGSVSVDLKHPITSGLLIELVAPDCTKFTIHNQTTTFPYKLRQPHDLGDLSGVGAAGQWTLHVHDFAKYWNGTLNGWTLDLESRGVVEGSGRTYAITQYVAGPGNYTLSLDGFDIRDRAGNHLRDTDPAVNEPYLVVGAARTCQTE